MAEIIKHYQRLKESLGRKKEKIKLGLIVALAVILPAVVLTHPEFYYEEDSFLRGLFGFHMLLAIAAPAMLIISPWRGYGARIFQLASFFIVPFLAAWGVQMLAGYESGLTEEVFWLNVFLAQIVYVLFLLLTQNYRAMMVLGSLTVTVIGIGNYFVHLFRGTPLLPWDIYAVGTAMEVGGAYDIALTRDILTVVLVMSLAVAVATRFAREKVRWYKRAADVVVLFLALSVCISGIYSEGFWYKFGLTLNAWDQNLTYTDTGILGGLFMNGKYLYTEEPEDYSVKKTEEIVEKYQAKAQLKQSEQETDELLTTEETDAKVEPHIIAIMNESFADLSVLGDFYTDKSYLSNFYSYMDNTVRGTLYSSVLGGTTCNSEFEFLTGNSMYFFGAGYLPYQQAINFEQPSLATILKDEGYTTVAMHPAPAKNWQRNHVYPLLGFDEFLDIDYFENPQMMRWYYVSDACDYNYLIKRFEEREEGEKMFIFNITIQNHGGYELITSGMREFVAVRDSLGRSNGPASQYISLIRQSDKDLKNLLDYFETVDEPVIICFFGDHQPSIGDEFVETTMGKTMEEFTFEDKLKQYQVPFMIWANYDLEEEYVDAISINYLGGLLLEKAGIEGNGYMQFLNELREEMPMINALGYMTNDGTIHEKDEDFSQNELIHDYQIVQYNVFHDKKGRLEELEK